MNTSIKFIRKANMWVHTTSSFVKEKEKQEEKWFCSRKKAEEYEKENHEEDATQT